MRLIGSYTSPFVRKIRVLLAEKKLPFEFILEDVWQPGTTIQSQNPLGKIPCLLVDYGNGEEVVIDSMNISDVIEQLHPSSLLPKNTAERIHVRNLEVLGNGMMEACVAMILEGRFHEGDKKSLAWLERQTGKFLHGAAAMDRQLAKGGPFLTGKSLTLADISLGVALLYAEFRFPQIQWRNLFPRLDTFAQQMAARPSFEGTQPPK